MAIRSDITQQGKLEPPRMDRFELLQRIEKVPKLKYKALICFLYLTGARIEEVTKYIKEPRPNRTVTRRNGEGIKVKIHEPILKRELAGLPLRAEQLEFKTDNSIIIHQVRTLKRRDKKTRTIPIPYNDNEKPFISCLNTYVERMTPDTPLFNITRSCAYKHLAKVGLYPHYLRHLRNTHLVIDYGFTTEHLIRFNGWKDSESAQTYIHLNVGDLMQKMNKD